MPLEVYQSMWAMEELPWKSPAKWTIDQQLDEIANAGFDGIGLEFDHPDAERIAAEAIARGLRLQASWFPQTIDDLRQIVELIDNVGREHVDHINLQPNVRPPTLGECIPYILGWQAIADDAEIPLYIETHRDRMTTDLLFTLELINAIPSLQLTADLSHFLVGREFRMPIPEAENALIRRILRRSHAYHGRVASREQVQVQISFPHHQLWLDLFAGWWQQGFHHFQKTIGAEKVLTFTTELGPPYWYSITGPDGNELSDRWAESLQLAALARHLWETAGTATASEPSEATA